MGGLFREIIDRKSHLFYFFIIIVFGKVDSRTKKIYIYIFDLNHTLTFSKYSSGARIFLW